MNIEQHQSKIETLAAQMNESTALSWFWALLFSALYFAFHGFWGRAVLVFALNFILIGFIVAPFLAYPAWRERAREKAERAIAAGVVV